MVAGLRVNNNYLCNREKRESTVQTKWPYPFTRTCFLNTGEYTVTLYISSTKLYLI